MSSNLTLESKMTREIPLTQGQIALVDDEDYERASQYKWHAMNKGGGKYYAVGWVDGRDVFLHVFLMNPPFGMEVDHIDGNGLNCQKSNMRLATHANNLKNMNKHRDNTSGFKGVALHKSTGKYQANIWVDGVQHYLGLFILAEEAAHVYDDSARFYHGEFASLNFPDETT